MDKPFRANVMLGDYAVVSDGKLTIVGAGWNFTGPDPTPSAICSRTTTRVGVRTPTSVVPEAPEHPPLTRA